MSTAARAMVDDVLGRDMTREIWSGNYDKALPLSIQDFDLSAILPAVFYMFRFGWRRGRGRFLEVFGGEKGTPRQRRGNATADRIASRLAATPEFVGFDGEVERAVLGDLLLCFCLENSKRALGRDVQVQRVLPAHYMASWVDLPDSVAHLRFVPEMIVALLADQKGEAVEPTAASAESPRTWFPVVRDLEHNVLLQAFHQGISYGAILANRSGDRFIETSEIGIDQLVAIRLAQQLGAAPDEVRNKGDGGARISNQRPIAERAAQAFSEDIRRFVHAYANVIPRHALVELLESCMSVGLTTILGSTACVLFEWSKTGRVPLKCDQRPWPLFVDCTNGVDGTLRAIAEESMDDFVRALERLPVIFMALRLLDHGVRYDPKLRSERLATRPYATAWLNLLGEVLFGRREEANALHYDFSRKAARLAERLAGDSADAAAVTALDNGTQALQGRLPDDFADAAALLDNENLERNPFWRLAEALTLLQGRGNTQKNLINLCDSMLFVNRPNGLAFKRKVQRKSQVRGAQVSRDVRSVVMTDAVLDYLVHRHVLARSRDAEVCQICLRDFLGILRDRYGFYVDAAPPGISASSDMLHRNRKVLEQRLRDLGLLVGVNDAESMKYLRPRFERREGNHAT